MNIGGIRRLKIHPQGVRVWTKQVIRMGHNEMVPTLVKQMREVCREHKFTFEMMVEMPRDLLRYNLKNDVRKSAARRAVEKVFKE